MTQSKVKKEPEPAIKLPNYIYLIDGEKGGAGKTLFARCLVHWFLSKGIPFTPVETDRSNPDLRNIYQSICQLAIFSESEKLANKADPIFQFAMESPVIVNLPAQAYRPVTDWITRNDLLAIGHEYNVGICKFFVSTGTFDSLELFKTSLRKFEGKIPHVLVKNLYFRENWDSVLNPPKPEQNQPEPTKQVELRELIERYKVKTIDFPKLDFDERDVLEEHKLTFEMAEESNALSILQKGRIRAFLRKFAEGWMDGDRQRLGVESTGLLPDPETAGRTEE